MKSVSSIFGRFILFLMVLAIGTFVILFVLEIVAIAIPPVQSYLSCPTGSNIEYTWVQESWDKPGQKTMERACKDSAGIKHEAFSDDVYKQRQFNLFLPISFVLMLGIEILWVIIRALTKKRPAQTNAAQVNQ